MIYVAENLKKQIMEMLSRGNSFQATQWLKSPHEDMGNKTPAELMKEEKIEIVFKILQKELKKK